MSERIVTFVYKIKDPDKARVLWGCREDTKRLLDEFGVKLLGLSEGDLVAEHIKNFDIETVECDMCGNDVDLSILDGKND